MNISQCSEPETIIATTGPDCAPDGTTKHRTMTFARCDVSAGAARAFVAESLTLWGRTERLDDIRVCVSELVTNALRHGTSAGQLILVSLEPGPAGLVVEVHDEGDGTPVERDAPADSEGGRGLFLVSALADDWGVTAHQDSGKRVWASFQFNSGGTF
ncbi:ATP-binding protein [Streptomyces sp. NPDC020607]|uniref:ATP-binding protein n=1 Tax=Streptomyces sp. NPDC020607 TaxID=3365082 RepID=UPI0037A51EF5